MNSVYLNNSSGCSPNIIILSSVSLKADHISTLASNNCSLILPYSQPVVNKIDPLSITINKESLHKIIYSPVFQLSTCSKYAVSKRVEYLCANWIPSDSIPVIILDSSVLSLVTFNFSRSHSYCLHFRHGSHDYSFEYIEFIINKFINAGYSLVSLIKVKNLNDIEDLISDKRDICIYLYDKKFLKKSELIQKQKKLGIYLLNCLVS